MDREEEKELEEVNKAFMNLARELMLSGIEPSMIAGVMSAGGIELYKQILSPNEYQKLKRTILGYESPRKSMH